MANSFLDLLTETERKSLSDFETDMLFADHATETKMIVGYNERLELLAKQYRDTKLKIEQAENNLADAKAALYRLTRETIPDVMAEVGFDSATLPTGTQINIKMRYDAKYVKKQHSKDVDLDKKRAFHDWMVENGFGSMIKSAFIVQVDPDAADVFRKICEEIGLEAEYKENTIHYKTLESWAKEQTEAGNELPNGLIDLWIGREASVK